MPKDPKKMQDTYTTENLRDAVEEVASKKSSYREASRKYGIPVCTIFNRINGRSSAIWTKYKLENGISTRIINFFQVEKVQSRF